MTKEEAEEARKQGNEAMKNGKHFEAIIHYTNAIKADHRNPEFYSNRSLALLKVDQFYHARLDAVKTIELKPEWPKGYYRKGEVEFHAQHFKDALESFRVGLSISPEDTGLQQAVRKASDAYKAQRQKERRVPWYGSGLGFLIGLMLVIADETVAPRPVLDNTVLKLLLVGALLAVGYFGAVAYNWFQKNQREVLMEEPVDIFGDGKDDDLMYPKGNSNGAASEENVKPSKHKKGGSVGGRQRFKKGKS